MSETQRILNNLRGKYIKRVLTQLEETDKINQETRKIILDCINDLMRDVFKELGYK